MLCAVLLPILLGGCLTSGDGDVIQRRVTTDLPPAPAFFSPVEVADPSLTDPDMVYIAARERAGRRRANTVILCGRRWYESVRAAHAAGMTAALPPCASPLTPTKKKG